MNTSYKKDFAVGLLLTLLFVAACQPKKHLRSSDNPDVWFRVEGASQSMYLDSLEAAVWDFQTLQARARGYLTINNKDHHEVNVQIRIKKDEFIWISATALMGLEAGRVLITPDSIQIINRLESIYIQEPFTAANQWLGQQMDFQRLQQILYGQVPKRIPLRQWQLSKDSLGSARFSGGPASNEEMIVDFLHRLTWWKGEHLEVLHAYAPGNPVARFPIKSTWSIHGETLELLATLEYSRVNEDQQLKFPFSIPNGYRRMH